MKTGGVLADKVVNYNFNVTLKSGADAFNDAFGNLDGDGDFDDTPGEDYTTSFVVNATTARVVSIRDFARGPGQEVDDSPAANNGLAVSIDDATDVRSLDFHFRYDPTYLVVSGASLAPGLAAMGWSITVNNSTPGDLIITSSSGANELSGLNIPVIIIDASVRADSLYGGAEILRFENVAMGIESGPNVIPVAHIEDRAIHKNVHLGDADGNHLYDGFDVTLMSRVAVGFDTGFGNNDWTNPLIIGDINSDGVINGIDTAIVAQKGIPSLAPFTPQIPNIVVTNPNVIGTGADPTLSIPDLIPAGIGTTVAVPVNIGIEPNVTLSSATYTVNYDPTKLQYVGVNAVGTFNGWSVFAGDSSPAPGTITILMSDATGHTTPDNGMVQNLQLATLTFNVLATTTGGTSNLNIAPVNPNEGGLIWTNNNVDDGSVQFTLFGDYNLNGTVDLADYVVWRKTSGTSVPAYTAGDGNGDGLVNAADYAIWQANFGRTAAVGPGAGAGVESIGFAAATSASLESPVAASVARVESVAVDQAVAAVSIAPASSR